MSSRHVGLEACVEELRKITDERIRPALAEAVVEGARRIQKEAKERVVKDTGALAESIKVRSFKKSQTAKVECDYPKVPPGTKPSPGQNKKYYAFAIEYGTPTSRARPFIGPAVEAKEDEVEDLIDDAMDKAINP